MKNTNHSLSQISRVSVGKRSILIQEISLSANMFTLRFDTKRNFLCQLCDEFLLHSFIEYISLLRHSFIETNLSCFILSSNTSLSCFTLSRNKSFLLYSFIECILSYVILLQELVLWVKKYFGRKYQYLHCVI